MKPRAKVWDLIVESGLIRSSQLSEIRTQFEGDVDSDQRSDSSAILLWLRDQKRISEFQMKVLAGGLPGPFRYESYQIHAKEEGDSLDGSFRGVHVASGHPVRLIFFGGDTKDDAHQWHSIQTYSRRLTGITSRFVLRCFDVVEDDEYRFLVTEFCKGQSLNQKLPYKGRLPWPQTLQAAEQIGLALTEIHKARLAHDRLWPGAVWLLPGGFCKVIWQVPNLMFDPEADPEIQKIPLAFQSPRAKATEGKLDLKQRQRNDLYSFGAVVFRLLFGKSPKIKQVDPERRKQEIEKHIEALGKYEIPENFLQVVRLLLSADVTDELKDAEVVTKLIGTILESQSTAADIDDPPESLCSFEKDLEQKRRSSQFADRLESFNDSRHDENAGRSGEAATSPSSSGGFDFGAIETNESGINLSARDRLEKRRSSKKNSAMPMLIGGGICVGAIAMGLLLSGVFTKPTPEPDQQQAEVPTTTPDEAETNTETANHTETNVGEIAKVSYRPQNVVEDDGELLWQSPTEGEPLELLYMPAAPDMVMSFRPARLNSNPQAMKMVQAFGPRFDELQQAVFSKLGIKPSQVELLVVSLHPDQQNQYSPFVIVQLAEPADPDAIWKGMGSPSSVKYAEIQDKDLFQIDDYEVFFDDDPEMIHTICFGPRELVRASLESSGVVMADRSIQSLVERGDGERDINLILRNSSLLSEPGIWLFDGPFQAFRRTLHLFFDDRIQATSLSMHFDEGLYMEFMTEQSQDFPNKELVEWLPEKLSKTRNELTQHVAQLAPNPYWAAVQLRYDNMLNELVRNTRTSVERGQVVSNCWLPESAGHNLVAASELVLSANSLGQGSATEATSTSTTPQTLQELLAVPRDLLVTTNPDLINLLRDIEQEIRDDYPKLPFQFRIKLLGGDLAVEGITQNQRPGEVRAEQESLEQILAKIMLQANPDKSATAPSDPNCKLIWVIGPDPDNSENEIIMVTTRKAAAERNMTLPKVFQPE